MRIGACVLARGGSKRLPKKNIRTLGDKPLVCWSLDPILESKVFADVTVSTESDEIAETVRSIYGSAVNILKRPDELAGDDSPPLLSFGHYLDNRPEIDFAGLFLPTYPFRKADRLVEIGNVIRSRYPWSVMSVTQRMFCTRDYYYPKVKDGELLGVKQTFRQFITQYGYEASSAYRFYDRNCLGDFHSKYPITHGERLHHVFIDDYENTDIDTPEDHAVATKLLNGCVYRESPLEEYSYNDWILVGPKGLDFDRLINFIGRDALEERFNPIVILDNCRYGSSALVTSFEGGPFLHTDYESVFYTLNMKMSSTGNSKYQRKEYRHNQHYRLIRLPKEHQLYHVPKSGPHDHHGTTIQMDYNKQPDECMVLSMDRVIFTEDLAKQDFYIDPMKLCR